VRYAPDSLPQPEYLHVYQLWLALVAALLLTFTSLQCFWLILATHPSVACNLALCTGHPDLDAPKQWLNP
jgi:hypothetical protein